MTSQAAIAAARFTLPVAVHLLLRREHSVHGPQILLLRRYNTGYEDGNYSMVAGYVDGGEPLKQAMRREAREEAGIEIAETDLDIVHAMHRLSDHERIDFFLRATKWQGEIRNREPHKCDELAWYAIDALPDNVIPYVRQGLEHVACGVSFSEAGWP